MSTFTNQKYHVLLSCTLAPRIRKRAQDLLCKIDVVCYHVGTYNDEDKSTKWYYITWNDTLHANIVPICLSFHVIMQFYGDYWHKCFVLLHELCMCFDCWIGLGFLFKKTFTSDFYIESQKMVWEHTHTHKIIFQIWKSFEFNLHLNWFQFKTYLINFKPTKE
jgi:hypothetical protein